ncbi:MAG: hydroxymethylpyrimidine/phosphomethylpyrimidine kinase [Candidatus Accumulibacter sp. UW26]|jgi:hydroxymethylpyrimidine/phosphomethylpyrimidine kinase
MNSHPASPSPPLVLTFAASDPSGGAGLQADLMTLSALGCHPLSVTTALTVQDTVGVGSIRAIDASDVEAQARMLLDDLPVAAFKVGLLGSIDNIRAIARIVADHPAIPLVLDPVLASGRGDPLADGEMISGLRELLMPLTRVLTPNLPEARRLLDEEATGDALRRLPAADLGLRLLDFGCQYVLVTGTHADTLRVVNQLYRQGAGLLRSDAWDRLPGSYHGSGCTLASAIAAQLAMGREVDQAVRVAQEYTWQSLAAGFRPGRGQFIPDRFFRTRARHAAGAD